MRRPLALVAALAVLGAVAATGRPSAPGRTAAVARVPVLGATAVCPDLRQRAGRLQTRISVGSALAGTGEGGTGPGGTGSGGTGSGGTGSGGTGSGGGVVAQPFAERGAPHRVALSRPGEVVLGVGAHVDQDALAVSAEGAFAAGLEVEQITRGTKGADRGLAGLRCGPPTTSAWFEGGGTQAGERTLLVLANPDDIPALVDVTMWSTAGPLDPRLVQGTTVAPHSRLLVQLDEIAPDRAGLALHVATRRGRVAAAVRDAATMGSIARGVDWVPQTEAPATSVVVPGLPAGPGRRALLVTNPGTDDTTVQVQVTTSSAQFVPTGLSDVRVPAGTTVVTVLNALAAHTPMAVRVTSSGSPVLAGASVLDAQTGPVRDISFTGAGAPLSGPALLTDLVIDRPTESTLLLSALDTVASVVVTPLRISGPAGRDRLPAARTVRVPAGRTAALRLSTLFPPGTSARLAVQVRPEPGSGPVHAARYLRERGATGPLATLLDLQGPASTVPQPAVQAGAEVGSTR